MENFAPSTASPNALDHEKMRVSLRLLAFLFAATPIALLAITTQLTPSATGLGTHQQLGLPPCSTRVIFGIPCPACGMTTSWSHFVRGHWLNSIQTNAGGFALAIFSLIFAGLSLRTAIQGEMPANRTQNRFTIALVSIALLTLAQWIYRLAGS